MIKIDMIDCLDTVKRILLPWVASSEVFCISQMAPFLLMFTITYNCVGKRHRNQQILFAEQQKDCRRNREKSPGEVVCTVRVTQSDTVKMLCELIARATGGSRWKGRLWCGSDIFRWCEKSDVGTCWSSFLMKLRDVFQGWCVFLVDFPAKKTSRWGFSSTSFIGRCWAQWPSRKPFCVSFRLKNSHEIWHRHGAEKYRNWLWKLPVFSDLLGLGEAFSTQHSDNRSGFLQICPTPSDFEKPQLPTAPKPLRAGCWKNINPWPVAVWQTRCRWMWWKTNGWS